MGMSQVELDQLKLLMDTLIESMDGKITASSARATIEAALAADLNGDGAIVGEEEQLAYISGMSAASKEVIDIKPMMQETCNLAAEHEVLNGVNIREELEQSATDGRFSSDYMKLTARAATSDLSEQEIRDLAGLVAKNMFPPIPVLEDDQAAKNIVYGAAETLFEMQVEVFKGDEELIELAAAYPDTSQLQELPYDKVCEALTGEKPGRSL